MTTRIEHKIGKMTIVVERLHAIDAVSEITKTLERFDVDIHGHPIECVDETPKADKAKADASSDELTLHCASVSRDTIAFIGNKDWPDIAVQIKVETNYPDHGVFLTLEDARRLVAYLERITK